MVIEKKKNDAGIDSFKGKDAKTGLEPVWKFGGENNLWQRRPEERALGAYTFLIYKIIGMGGGGISPLLGN